MEIPDCTAAPVCSRCGPLSWPWSLRRGAWVAFVPDPLDPLVLRFHRCAHAQDRSVWRDTYRGDPPSSEYVEIKEQLTKGDLS